MISTDTRPPARSALLVLFGLLLLFGFAAPGEARATELTITVENVRNDKGVVRVSVYASPAEWPDKSTREHDQAKPAQPGPMVFRFNLPPGVYAVNAFHDEKNSGKFETNFLGMPREGYGFSNDVRPGLSAPSFYKAAFTLLPVGGVIHFKLVYP